MTSFEESTRSRDPNNCQEGLFHSPSKEKVTLLDSFAPLTCRISSPSINRASDLSNLLAKFTVS